jgi:hypothetical protein
MTTTYQIIGLSKKEIQGHSYKTDYRNRIMHDENGRGISFQKMFPDNTLYAVSSEDIYYAIHLSQSDGASFGKKLCNFGHMNIVQTDYVAFRSNITHIPIKPLHIKTDRDWNELGDDEEFLKIYLKDEPSTCVFTFSSDGCDEATPCGYVYVNMQLFHPITPKPHN